MKEYLGFSHEEWGHKIDEIHSGKNAHMYGELLKQRNRFDEPTWQFGVNYFFMGGLITDQFMESYLLNGTYPQAYQYDGKTFYEDGLNDLRALQLLRGELRLPKSWDDLKGLGDVRRRELTKKFDRGSELVSLMSEEQRGAVQSAIAGGKISRLELFREFPNVSIDTLETCLQIYLAEISAKSLSVAMDIIEQLRQEELVQETLETGMLSIVAGY